MSYINRHMEQRITEPSKTWSAILLTCLRQSGKTTMLKNLAEKENIGREYISLDDLTVREMAKNDPKMFLQLHKPPIVIDEVQYAPQLFTYIKIHVDTHHKPGDFWLTGSQVFSLMKGVQESLAGRVALLHMSPLSQREIVGAEPRPFTTDFDALVEDSKNIQVLTTPQLYERIWNGCMPGLASGEYTDRNMYYSSYLSTYIERDVRELSGAIDALKFTKFITAVAARASQLVNYKAMADDADIDQLTAKAWLQILETLGIIFLLHPYSNNVLKRTIKTPKLYFYDKENELQKSIARQKAVATLYERLYEDNVLGKVMDEWFMRLSHKYEVERMELKAKISALQTEIRELDGIRQNKEHFIRAIRKFMQMDTLLGKFTIVLLILWFHLRSRFIKSDILSDDFGILGQSCKYLRLFPILCKLCYNQYTRKISEQLNR